MPRLDAGQRAREFPRRRHPRNQRRLNIEAQLQALSNQVLTATALATQPDQSTFDEILPALPEPTAFDFGRRVVVQLPGETLTSSYLGTLGPDDVVYWQLMAVGVAVGGQTSPEFTFVGHVAAGGATTGVHGLSSAIYFMIDTQNVRRYDRSNGAITIATSEVPTGSNTGQGLHAESNSAIWAGVPATDDIEYWDGSLPVNTTSTAEDYWALHFDTISGALFATDMTGNEAKKVNKTTLAVISSFGTGLSGPKGIVTDGTGAVYIADTGNNRIRKYTAALAHSLDFGSAGSGNGQFSGPQGMAVDAANRIYVADSGNDRVQVFDPSGAFLGQLGSSGSGAGQLDNPVDVDVVGTNITVSDRGNSRLSLWTRN